ncbi:uncharacterized protein PAC_02244 [Phialocephala subalpina]|uniref:N-acetyltransferase domain-containing protein n=1 Tax=Phialocephala subalpina TaxID=576137 RepID=A0A1L7WHX8_9HELO|nr:uncharacterized protein PAC_02244 [Phialocephala subalpina]
MAYSLHKATLDDIQGMTEVWFHSFNNPSILSQCYVVVMKDSEGKVVAFARYFKFDETWTEDWKQRWWPEVAEEVTDELMGEAFLLPMARQHRVGMGRRPHYCTIPLHFPLSPFSLLPPFPASYPFLSTFPFLTTKKVLEVLATHESYRGLGLGAQLIEYGCKKADEDGLEMYLDAAEKARPLYGRWGYIVQEHRDAKAVSSPMRREAKVKGAENGSA